MKLAVMADIHSNFPAFEACLRDAHARGAEGYVFLGDLVTDLPYPWRTMDAVYNLKDSCPCLFVRGNRERYMLSARGGKAVFRPGSKEGSLLYTYENLRQKDLDFFDSLPIYRSATADSIPFEIAHALKTTDSLVFEEDDPFLDTVFSAMETGLFLTGHSHRQYIREKGGAVILNPGSLGIPQGKPGFAQYALAELSPDGNRLETRLVPYDVPRVIQEQFESGLADMAPFWSVGVLNNIVTGKNAMLDLLKRVEAVNGAFREAIWEKEARLLGLAVTRE